VQKEVVMRCRQMGKPVIVASHLLQSMIEYPTPTRAEVLSSCRCQAWSAALTHIVTMGRFFPMPGKPVSAH